jgi:5-dehydro-4-deoxyglucarate dehydratase
MERFSAEIEGVAQRLREGMTGGVLSFPLTSFRDDGALDLESYRTYVTAQLSTALGAVFPACGTGEFSALDEDEYRAVAEATGEVADGRLPVVAGIGHGWAQALRFARIAEEAGAEALLVLPQLPGRSGGPATCRTPFTHRRCHRLRRGVTTRSAVRQLDSSKGN